MVKRTISSGNALGIALALIIFVVGVSLSLTVVGAIIGIPLCILALFIGGKRRKVWRCRKCSSIIDRA